MKRRIISLLAILAILCTMVVFAMPTTVAAAETYPQYKNHVAAIESGHDGKNWSISEPEDWLAMIETAGAVAKGETYFDDVTFHLTKTIDFDDQAMLQLGTASEDENKVSYSRYFGGTINGHGFGFKNILIQDLKGTTSGLINLLADSSFIDFGVDSGTINRNNGNGSTSVSTFGALKPGCTVNFTRVWSGAYIRSLSNGHASALVGAPAGTVEATINVNGFVFDGLVASDGVDSIDTDDDGEKETIENLKNVYGVVGSHGDEITGDHSYRNILVDGVVSNPRKSENEINAGSTPVDYPDPAPPYGMFRFKSGKPTVFENVYGIIGERNGFHKLSTPYFIGTLAQTDDDLLMTDAMEAAWKINNAQTGEGPDAVYYTVNDEGKIRPIPEGKSEGKIVGITVEIENITKNICVKPGSTVNLKTALGYTSDVSFVCSSGDCTIADDRITVTVGTGDVTVVMTNSCVDHDFDYEQGDKEHTATCSKCNHTVTEACVLTGCTPEVFSWNAYTHTGSCDCGNAFSEACDYEYKEDGGEYKYVCFCGREEAAPAPVVVGDVDEKNGVDLVDAIHLLKKFVGKTVTINKRNSDVDGDNDSGINDVYKIILYVMNDKATKEEFKATQEKVNEPNFYTAVETYDNNLTMLGVDGTNDRYVSTEGIPVSEGNKIVFGPVRKSQAVLGHFYDKDGNPTELININNERLNTGKDAEYVFKAEVLGKDVEITNNGESVEPGEPEPTVKVVDGLEMVSIVAPKGAAYVRLQANAQEHEEYYIRINNEFSLADYQCRTNGDANTLTNAERDQLFLTVGDSLAAAARDTYQHIYTKKGWEGRINLHLGAKTVDSSQGGTTLSTVKYYVGTDSVNDTDTNDNVKYSIVNQITMHRNGQPFEYILIEGGANDAAYAWKTENDPNYEPLPYDTKIGFYENDDPEGKQLFNKDSHDPAHFAPPNTFIGGLERAIYTTIKTYGDTAAIGYMLPYPIYNEKYKDNSEYKDNHQFELTGDYFQYVEAVCEKWKIPYLDLYYENLNNFDIEKYTSQGYKEGKDPDKPDYVHANGPGYDMIQKFLEPFVTGNVPDELKEAVPETMRPADQEIYRKIQKYDNVPQNLNKNSK